MAKMQDEGEAVRRYYLLHCGCLGLHVRCYTLTATTKGLTKTRDAPAPLLQFDEVLQHWVDA